MLVTIIDYEGYGYLRTIRVPYDRPIITPRDIGYVVQEVAEWELSRIGKQWEENGGRYIGDILTDEYGESYYVDIWSDHEVSGIDLRPMPETEEEDLGESTRDIIIRKATREEVEEFWKASRAVPRYSWETVEGWEKDYAEKRKRLVVDVMGIGKEWREEEEGS